MASEYPSDPDFFFTQMHRYLTQRRLTFDTFFSSLKLSSHGKITYSQFTNIITRLMATLNIEAINVSNLFRKLTDKKDLIDLIKLKEKYFDSIGTSKSQSKSIEASRKSVPKDVHRSIEKVKLSQEEDKDVNKAELGLDYLIGSETVKQKLKRSLVDKDGRYKPTMEGLYQFIRYCNLKELSRDIIKEKIAKKLYRALTGLNQSPKHRKFYSEALNIAKNLQLETNHCSKAAKNYFTDRTNFGNQIPEESKVQTDRSKQGIEVIKGQAFQSFSQKLVNLAANCASQAKNRRRIHGSNHRFAKARVASSSTQREKSGNTHSFIENQSQLISMNDKILQEQREKLQSSLQRLENKKKRWMNTEERCKIIAEKNRMNKSIGYKTPERQKTKQNAHKQTMCETDRLQSLYKSVQGTIKSSYFLQKGYLSNSIEKHTITSSLADKKQFNRNLNKDDFRALYPQASKYYRLKRNPTQQELPFFLELDTFLRRGAAFHDEYNPHTKYDYLRANKLLKCSKYYVFSGDISKLTAERVRRGKHGSSHLMSFLAAFVDKYPEFISNMFLFRANPARYYCVKVFIDGEETIIKTDDKFPSSNQRPIYASPTVNEIWTMLIQKAYAKVYNGYSNICEGSLEEITSLLTGHSMLTSHKVQSMEDLQQIIKVKDKGALTIGYTMEISPVVRNKLSVAKGIDTSQSYSLLDIAVNNDGGIVFKMFNPQGNNYQSKGAPQCEAIELFYQARSRELKRDQKNGYFYIVWDDFKKYFRRVISCQFASNYSLSTLRLQALTKSKESIYDLQLQIFEEGTYSITIIQPQLRRIRCNYANIIQQYSQCKLEFKRSTNNCQSQGILQVSSSDWQTSLKEIQLQTGNFQLRIALISAQPTQKTSYIICAGPARVKAKQVQPIAIDYI